MKYYISGFSCSDELYHYQIPGAKHGVRRFQDSSGRYTEEGFLRYYGHPRLRDSDGSLTSAGKTIYKVGDTAKNAANAVGRAAKATGQAVGKAGKAVAKHEVEKFKMKHPWMMSDAELDAANAKYKKIEALRNSREAARGKTFMGKLSNTLWKSVGIGTDKLAENYAVELGKGYAKRFLLSYEEKETKRLQDQNELTKARKNRRENALQAKKDYDDFKYRKALYDNSKELEREAAYKEAKSEAKALASKAGSLAKAAYTKATTPKPGSAKSVDEYARRKAYEEEKARRMKLYGPGGTAWR